jgi:hypothetical protein
MMLPGYELLSFTTSTPITVNVWWLDTPTHYLESVAWANVRTNIAAADVGAIRCGLASDQQTPPLIWDIAVTLKSPTAAPTGVNDYESSFGLYPLRLPPCGLRMAFFIATGAAPWLPEASLTMTILARRRQ